MKRAKGCIFQLEKNYYRVLITGGLNPATGKKKRISKYVRGSRKEAEKVLASMLVEQGETEYVREQYTLNDFFNDVYIPSCRSRLRATTVVGYENKYNTHIKEHLGDRTLQSLKPSLITNWLDHLDSESSKFHAFKMLRQILNKAVRLDLMDSNPCSRVEHPKNPSKYEPEVLKAEEIGAYLDLFKGSNLEAGVLIALGCGLRRSEIVALNWSDISEGSVLINKAITSVKGRAIEDKTKTVFSERSVVIPKSINARLESLREPGKPILQDSNGNRLNPDNFSKQYNKMLENLPDDVSRVTLKNLRHTSLSLAMDRSENLLAVSRRAGHSSVNITAKYYLRPSKEVDSKTAEALDEVFNF